MRRALALLVVATLYGGWAGAASAQDRPDLPSWAYPMAPAPAGGAAGGGGGAGAAPAPDPTRYSLPGSSRQFTRAEVGGQEPADWRPDLHPPMPDIVAKGRTDVRACALCHYPNGQGRPENGPVSGLPAAYILQQLVDFQNGTRVSSEPRMGPPAAMVRLAKAMTAEEMAAAADYFSSFPYRKWIRVVEADMVPKLRFAGGMFVPGEGMEPIGNRIVEVPEDTARTSLRDPASGFIAYVPPGSISRGQALAQAGMGGRTTACSICHGLSFEGRGPVPGIAGRSASYIMRQLVDFKSGARKGAWSDLMKPVVAQLNPDEMLWISAYVASLEP